MCFFDKSNDNSMIVNALEQRLHRRESEKLTVHGYPVNGCVPK